MLAKIGKFVRNSVLGCVVAGSSFFGLVHAQNYGVVNEGFGRISVEALAPASVERPVTFDTRSVQVVTNPNSSFDVKVWTEKSSYRVGERASVCYQTTRDAYVYLYSLGTDGKVTQVLPNRFDQNNFSAAHQTICLPRSGYALEIVGPSGTDQLVAFANTMASNSLSGVAQLPTASAVFPEFNGDWDAFGSATMGRIAVAAEHSVPFSSWAMKTYTYKVSY